MTPGRRDPDPGAARAPYRAASAAVLADRMAAALVHHEPGWRLPRLTALARRYCVSTAEVGAAIDELAARHLVRRLPDGQVYRASPAEYWVPLAGVPGLRSHVDPMGGQLVCKSRQSSRRRPPEDIGRSLGLAPGDSVVTVRCLWTVGGEPGALSTSFLAEPFAAALGELPAATNGADGGPNGEASDEAAEFGASEFGAGRESGPSQPDGTALAAGPPPDGPRLEAAFRGGDREPPPGNFLFPWSLEAAATARPQAVQLEMSLPPPSAARSLRVAAGEPVATVTVSFAYPAAGSLAALTTAMMRAELFRFVLAVPGKITTSSAEGSPSTWTHAGQGWEP
jgi:hypothetical protein